LNKSKIDKNATTTTIGSHLVQRLPKTRILNMPKKKKFSRKNSILGNSQNIRKTISLRPKSVLDMKQDISQRSLINGSTLNYTEPTLQNINIETGE
jgi:hypothetical protein